MGKFTEDELDKISRYHNWFVDQDADGNLTWNNSPTAEYGWRPVSAEQIAEALKGDALATEDHIELWQHPASVDHYE